MRRKLEAVIAGLALVMLAGCLRPHHPNEALDPHDARPRYRFDAIDRGPENTDRLFICLTFSGGGTRAAAFAYGVLDGLRQTVMARGAASDASSAVPGRKTLAEEIDVISGVSGGSFTAMGYGLWGDDLFDGRFRARFLESNVQAALILNLLRPRNLLAVPLLVLDTIDIAADYYDRMIFEGQTYGDLLSLSGRPFIVVNATDVARRQRFEFTQDDFDLLGSDLTTLPVGWAVAASSAFPLLLSPMRLKYFPGEPMADGIEAVLAADTRDRSPRRAHWATTLLERDERGELKRYEIDGDAHQYLYLLDGGLADNLGISHVIESYRFGPIGRRIDSGAVDRFVVIIVDAANDPPKQLESRRAAPNILTIGERVGTTGIHNNSRALTAATRFAMIESLRETRQAYDRCEEAIGEECPDAEAPAPPAEVLVEPYLIDINFRRIRDYETRRSFLSLVTSFFLPTEDVEALIQTGRQLLCEHEEYRRLLNDLGAAPPAVCEGEAEALSADR